VKTKQSKMNINRHNYEELFLLYVDQELTAAERVLVEAFVQENPDLKVELELLQQATLHADFKLDDAFKNKLLKQEAVTEEQLLLLLDGELRREEAATIKTAIDADAELQKDWAWLQRSQLNADESIVFPDKSLLYKEAQPARVFYMSAAVRRWSAAAAVLLMLGTGYWLYNQQKPVDPVAEATPSSKQPQITVPVPSTNNVKENNTEELVQEQPVQQQSNTVTPAIKQEIIKQTPVQQQNRNTIAVSNQPKQEQLPVTVQQETNLKTQNTIVKTEINTNPNGNNLPTSTVPHETSIAATPNVSFANYDEAGDEDEQEGLLNENKQRSTGLKALFKKAKRTLERRTGIQSGESQVRFAVFAINTQ
jgi:hypothetical protein